MNISFFSSRYGISLRGFLPIVLTALSVLLPSIAHAQIFVTSVTGGTINEYNTTTGAAINTTLVSHLSSPHGLALSNGNLFVVNRETNSIGEYTTAGAIVNGALISGLNTPSFIAISGNNIYVTNTGNNTIGEYTTAGATVNATLISGLNDPEGIVVSGNFLFIVNNGANEIDKYNATTGALITSGLVTGLSNPFGLTISNGNLYVANRGNGTIGVFNATTGATVNSALVSGASLPFGIAIAGSNLFAARTTVNYVSEYTTAGATTNATFITGVRDPFGIAIHAPAPVIATNPINTSIVAGKSATFSVSATSADPVTYQWQVSTDGGNTFSNLSNGIGISGVTLSNLIISTSANSTTDNGNQYQCVVTNIGGASTSNPATLTVEVLPKITVQATATSALFGTSANFSVTATGSSLTYQWQFSLKGTVWSNVTDGNGTSGSATAMLSANASSTGFYRCIVTNAVGTVTSAKTALTVTFPPGGIYFGTFSGKVGAGKFATLVLANQDTILFGYNTTKKTAFVTPIFTLSGNGDFTTNGGGNSTVTGVFTDKVVTANITSDSGSGKVTGTHKADTGAFSASEGFYTGTYQGTVSGSMAAMLAADGTFLIYSVSNNPEDPGDGIQGTIAKTNKFTLTTTNGTKITGTLNPDSHIITGTYKTKLGSTGTFEFTQELGP